MQACCCSYWRNTFRGSLKKRRTSTILSVTLDISFTGALGMVIKFSAAVPQDSLSKSDVWLYLTILILCLLWAATVPSYHFFSIQLHSFSSSCFQSWVVPQPSLKSTFILLEGQRSQLNYASEKMKLEPIMPIAPSRVWITAVYFTEYFKNGSQESGPQSHMHYEQVL